MFKVGAAFAHSQSKTTCQRFRALFVTVSAPQKEFLCKYMTTWIHHFTPESNQQSAGESCPKQLKTQILAGMVLASVF